MKLMDVPAGTGLAKRSDAMMLYVFFVPSMSKPSMLRVPCDREKLSCEGKPTAMDRLLDTVVIVDGEVSDATIRTGVGTVPELTKTETWPLLSLTFVSKASGSE